MSAEREHYPVICRLDQMDIVLLWYSDDTDGLITDSKGFLTRFADLRSAITYARENALAIVGEGNAATYDLDKLDRWVVGDRRVVDCAVLLNCWNLFADVAASTGHGAEFSARDQAAGAAYDKLFFGSNLPGVTPPGCEYEPIWSEAELDELAAVMSAGLQLVRGAIGACGTTRSCS